MYRCFELVEVLRHTTREVVCMGTYSFEARMPMAMHPNTYLDVIWEHDKIQQFHNNATNFSFDMEYLSTAKGVAAKLPLFDYQNKIVDGILQEIPVGAVSEGKLLRFPTRWKKPNHRVVMNRNTTYWASQQQKAADTNNGMGGIISYKQPKRGVAMAMFHLYESLVLLQRANIKYGYPLPTGFEFKDKDKLTIDDIKSRVIGGIDQEDIEFPIVKDFTSSFQAKDSEITSSAKGWYGLDFEDGGIFMVKHKKILKSMKIEPTRDVKLELEALSKLKPITKQSFPYNVSALLKFHKFAYYRMMVDDCQNCNVEAGNPCKLEKLAVSKEILKSVIEVNYVNKKIPRLYTAGKAGADDEKGRRKKLKDFLDYYYKFSNIYNKPLSDDGLISKLEAEKMWKEWDANHRTHVLQAIGKRGALLLPFSCEQRLKISNYASTFSKIIQAGMFPLILRKGDIPNEGNPNRYFGGVHPPSLTVQNLWVDFMKRVLSSKLSKDKDRLGVESGEQSLRLLWQCLDNAVIKTVKLDDGDSGNGKKIRLLRLTGQLESLRFEVKSNTEWNWNDKRDWTKRQGKLPIVSMNTSIEEIHRLFDEYTELPGVAIAIDQWHIKGEENMQYNYSIIDDEYNINEKRFCSTERTGARTFATFLKRIIDTEQSGILSSEVIHARRAYGVLLRDDFDIKDE